MSQCKLRSKRCALCKEYKELQESHFIPKSIYRRLKNNKTAEPSTLIRMDVINKKSYLTNNQFKQKLLCFDCEQLFNVEGENKVIPQLRSNGNFDLFDLLTDDIDVLAADEDQIAELNRKAYVYFATSIAWKGSVTQWPYPCDSMYRRLGPYENSIGSWLYGTGEFPKKVSVDVLIDSDDGPPALGHPFISINSDLSNSQVYQFIALGVWFKVYVGGTLTDKGKEYINNGPYPIVFRKVSFSELGMNREINNRIIETERKGKLARLGDNY